MRSKWLIFFWCNGLGLLQLEELVYLASRTPFDKLCDLFALYYALSSKCHYHHAIVTLHWEF